MPSPDGQMNIDHVHVHVHVALVKEQQIQRGYFGANVAVLRSERCANFNPAGLTKKIFSQGPI